MTLHATRHGQKIMIHGNTGVEIEVKNSQLYHVGITEDVQHVRYFWHQLGKHLDDAEQELKAAQETDSAT